MQCRHCQAPVSLPLIDLDTAPPSNAYVSQAALSAPEKWYPLRVFTCTHCWLVQTEDYAHCSEFFSGDYAYFSSFSSSWLTHAERYVAELTERLGLDQNSHVVEVASNDGYLLQYVQQRGIPCLGIEPTTSTAQAARAKNIPVIEEFFGVALAQKLVGQGQAADLSCANNVLAHVPDINDFVAGFTHLLKPQGVATFEFPHLMQMLGLCQFDTIYHEHFSYLSLTAVRTIFEKNGLHIFDVQELPTHGGSLRVFAQRQDTLHHAITPAVAALLKREQDAGVNTAAYYAHFQTRANALKDELLRFLLEAKRDHLTVGAYGAAAKGNTLLNYAGVRSNLLPWVVDRNPAKQGKYLPGCRIPIVDEAHLQKTRPHYVVILPWNLRAEVMQQLAYIREWGGKFVTAVPSLEVL
jgi:SAM-dependent methyltransferase